MAPSTFAVSSATRDRHWGDLQRLEGGIKPLCRPKDRKAQQYGKHHNDAEHLEPDGREYRHVVRPEKAISPDLFHTQKPMKPVIW